MKPFTGVVSLGVYYLLVTWAAAQQPPRPVPRNINVDSAGQSALEIVRTTMDPEVKWRAIRVLGALRYEPSVPELVYALGHYSPPVRANAARALGDMGAKGAVDSLVALLDGEADGGVIQQTSLALQLLAAKDAVPALRAAANHRDPQTRGWVLAAVGELGGRRDAAFLAAFLDDPDLGVQSSAAEALQQLTGVKFGLPEGGLSDASAPVDRAKAWWAAHKKAFPDL